MKNLIAVILILSTYASTSYSQNEDGWLEHSYLQINYGLQYDQLIGSHPTFTEVGYFVKGPKSVFGGSIGISTFGTTRVGIFDAKIKYGRFLRNSENKNWNILAMCGLAYINAWSQQTLERTGHDDLGRPTFNVTNKGGRAIGIPVSIELHTNKINRSGFNIKLETTLTTQLNLYYSVAVGINLRTN